MKDLIRRNCTFLLMGAVSDGRKLFSRPFLKHLEGRWSFGFRAMGKLRKRLDSRYHATARSLQRDRRVDSLLDLVA